MIFVTVGTDVHGFERLAEAMDRVAREVDDEVVMQLGHTEYRPRNAEGFGFTSTSRIESLRANADVIVAHAGAGTLVEILRTGTPAVVVPRRARYGEHVDDHQLELAGELADRETLFVVRDVGDLRDAVERAKSAPETPRDASGRLPSFLDRHLRGLEA